MLDQTPQQPLVSIENLRVEFDGESGPIVGVKDVSFTVNPGETVCVVGESGSGKSVTSLSLLRLVEFGGGRIVSGRLWFRPGEGEAIDLAQMPAEKMIDLRGDRDRHDLPGADDRAEPGLHDRTPADRRASPPPGAARLRGRCARDRTAARGAPARAGAAASAVSTRAFGGACASGSSSPWPWPAARSFSSRTSRQPRST